MSGAAACILTAVLAANQAAALPAASVPYLVAQGPVPLRFARPRPVAPPPPPPEPPPVAAPVEAKSNEEHDPAASPPTESGSPLAGADPGGRAPAGESPADARAEPAPVIDTGAGEVELLPDTFAPPGGVRVEQLLPFFLPPPAPVSRATYEQK